MAAPSRDAGRQRELIEKQKQTLADRRQRVVDEGRATLDWKARLRRDGPQIAAIGGAIVLLAVGSLVLRRTLRRRREEEDVLAAAGGEIAVEDLAREIRALREQLAKSRKGEGGGGGIAVKLGSVALGAAASAAGKTAATRLMERQEAQAA